MSSVIFLLAAHNKPTSIVNCASISPVIFGIAPGRGLSYRAFSTPPSTNFLQIFVMVGMEYNKADVISFVPFFFFWLSSVNSKIRARV
jgi:hypothetical protein